MGVTHLGVDPATATARFETNQCARAVGYWAATTSEAAAIVQAGQDECRFEFEFTVDSPSRGSTYVFDLTFSSAEGGGVTARTEEFQVP